MLILISVITGCSTERRDPVEPLLPQYSEEGVGAAGCIYNGESAWRDLCHVGWFMSDCDDLYIHYDTIVAKTFIRMRGAIFGLDEEIAIGFELNDIIVDSYGDLNNLEGQMIPLDGVSGRGNLSWNFPDLQTGQLECDLGEIVYNGQLHVRNVSQYTNIKGERRYTFSGTFGFDFTSPCWEYTLYQGRFDYGLDEFSFRPI